MSSPKKPIIAALSATALVASIGYAFAQSSDDTALANSNWNGGQNSADNTVNGPPAMPSSAVSAYNAEVGAADNSTTAADQSSTMAASPDYSTSSSSTSSSSTAAPDSTSPWTADSSQSSTSSTATSTDPNAASPSGGNPTAGTSPDKTDITHPAVAPQGDAMQSGTAANPSMTANTTVAPAAAPQTETRIDLNSPDEPLYNLPSGSRSRHHNANASDAGSSGERAPRADRN